MIKRIDLALIETLLFGNNSFNQYHNSRILDAAIALVTPKRVDNLLLVSIFSIIILVSYLIRNFSPSTSNIFALGDSVFMLFECMCR